MNDKDTKQDKEDEAKPASLIVVQKITDEDRTIRTDISLQGIEPTEVQTLLEMAVLSWRQRIGLAPR
jgi:hypothetical protein